MQSTTSVFIVHTNPVEGREDEYNDWYNNTHLTDVVAVPGITRARRYEISEAQDNPLTTFRYVAIYEIEGDPSIAMDALHAALEAGMYVSESLSTQLYSTVYEPITDWVVEPTLTPPSAP